MKILEPRIIGDTSSFTRSTTGTYVDSDGLVKTAAINIPRTNFYNWPDDNPVLLYEISKTNQSNASEDFKTTASWRAFVIPRQAVSPDGLFRADKLCETSFNGTHETFVGLFDSLQNNNGTFSIFVKPVERTRVRLQVDVNTNQYFRTDFNITTLEKVSSSLGGGSSVSSGIYKLSNGWYRIFVTGTINQPGSVFASIWTLDDNGNDSFTGVSGSGLYIWGRQFETLSDTSYIPSTESFTSRSVAASYCNSSGVLAIASTNVQRIDYDPISHISKGLLLELSATNLILQSEDCSALNWLKSGCSVSPNLTVAVDGNNTADKLVEDSLSSDHYIACNASITSGNTYTFSTFVRAAERTYATIAFGTNNGVFSDTKITINLSSGAIVDSTSVVSYTVQPWLNNWYRVSITTTAIATGTGQVRVYSNNTGTNSTSYSGDGNSGIYVWGSQLEVGVFPTSYIATTTAASTRQADVWSKAAVTRAADVFSSSVNTLSSNIVENDYADWDSGVAYTIGQYVKIINNGNYTTHKIYRALTNNSNTPPATNPNDWLDVGTTNRFKMFDTSVQSQTTNADIISTSIYAPGYVTSVALLNVNGTSVRVSAYHYTEGLIYDETQSLGSSYGIVDWYTYFFNPIDRRTDVLFENIPQFANCSINITIVDEGNTAACGACLLGFSRDVSAEKLGVEHGAKVSIQDYSVKQQDDFGNYTILERSFSNRADFTVYIEPQETDNLHRTLARLRATPTLYIGTNDYASTWVYGFYKDFTVEIAYSCYSVCTIQLEGLT